MPFTCWYVAKPGQRKAASIRIDFVDTGTPCVYADRSDKRCQSLEPDTVRADLRGKIAEAVRTLEFTHHCQRRFNRFSRLVHE